MSASAGVSEMFTLKNKRINESYIRTFFLAQILKYVYKNNS